MRSIFRLTAAIIFGFSCLSFLSALETGKVEFNINFYDRQIYYVETGPIKVQITITNNSPYPYRFKLADDRGFSVDFDIRTMTNRQLETAESLIRKRNEHQTVFFREITIESGESFSFTEDLRDYVSFRQNGSYRVKARIFPELYRSTLYQPIESNYLNLTLRPALIRGNDGIPLEMDIATGAVLTRQRLSPDEAVAYMLSARQESQWERFFLYLDLDAMLLRDAYQRRRWNAENEEGRRRMSAEYRQSLRNSTVDEDISVIPTSFEILRTVYNNEEGEVIALLKFRLPTFTQLRQYTYYLEKQDNFWVIVNYTVQGLGTEANELTSAY
ncbi:MAG: hypothetical protein LBU66_04380 [Treponema sp.]|jgi:hypothetical protein|nr:hypothetical protein [Treponema sp.]